jgi:hypothetical protein
MFLRITFDELVEVVRTCDQIEIETCTPVYLKDFIAKRLAKRFDLLAATVMKFSAEQMRGLCAYIKDTHALIRV